jgi:FixJ family two-component response regulator
MESILVVTTDLRLQEQIKLVLSLQKYQLHFASTSVEGYQIFKRLLPQIVLVDFTLDSFKNGMDLIKYFQGVSNYFSFILAVQLEEVIAFEKTFKKFPSNSLLFKPVGKAQLKGMIELKKMELKSKQLESDFNKFTKSELKILELIQQQMRTRDIAELLSISEKTVKNHRYNICKKLNFKEENSSIYKWLQNN